MHINTADRLGNTREIIEAGCAALRCIGLDANDSRFAEIMRTIFAAIEDRSFENKQMVCSRSDPSRSPDFY